MEMEIFCKVKDPRVLGKVRHELEDVLRMALIGVLCDCEDCDDISDMVTDREEEFRASGLLKLTNGVPCGDTIHCTLSSLSSPPGSGQIWTAAAATSWNPCVVIRSSLTARNCVVKIQ